MSRWLALALCSAVGLGEDASTGRAFVRSLRDQVVPPPQAISISASGSTAIITVGEQPMAKKKKKKKTKKRQNGKGYIHDFLEDFCVCADAHAAHLLFVAVRLFLLELN